MIQLNMMLGLGIIYVLYGIVLYNLGKDNNNIVKFHLASIFLYLPIALLFLMNTALINITGGNMANNVIFTAILLFIAFGWVEMLRSLSGKTKIAWFFIIFLIPVIYPFYWIGENVKR